MSDSDRTAQHAYWRNSLKMIICLLSIWVVFAFVLPFFLVDQLNQIEFGGFKLGFWMAQQAASLYSFF